MKQNRIYNTHLAPIAQYVEQKEGDSDDDYVGVLNHVRNCHRCLKQLRVKHNLLENPK